MILETNNHSVFSLNYHLVMVIKYRKNVINEKISIRLKEIFDSIAVKYKIVITKWNHDKDHIHVLFSSQPKTELTKFINAYKSASSRLIKKEFPIIRKSLWKETFWNQSFFLITVGKSNLEIINNYIDNQGQK